MSKYLRVYLRDKVRGWAQLVNGGQNRDAIEEGGWGRQRCGGMYGVSARRNLSGVVGWTYSIGDACKRTQSPTIISGKSPSANSEHTRRSEIPYVPPHHRQSHNPSPSLPPYWNYECCLDFNLKQTPRYSVSITRVQTPNEDSEVNSELLWTHHYCSIYLFVWLSWFIVFTIVLPFIVDICI